MEKTIQAIGYSQEIMELIDHRVNQRVAQMKAELREELAHQNQHNALVYNPTPEDEETRKRSEEEYKYKDYLGILLQLHQAGHECHEEINKTLKKVQSLMF